MVWGGGDGEHRINRPRPKAYIQTCDHRWNDAESCNDLIEALKNYEACTFMVSPWDWTALLLLRVCHEVHYFGQVTTDTKM